MLPINQILLGDAIEVLKSLPDNSIDCCVTSPPYFQMCDYEHDDQYGLEPTIAEYLSNISKVFSEVYRVLKDGSCCWIVIGDTMNNYSPVRAKGQRRKLNEYSHRRRLQAGYREKEALSIPHQLADQLRSDGWLHRQTLIWDKGNSGGMVNSDSAPLTHETILQMGKWNKRSRPYLRCQPLQSSVLKFGATSDPVHPCPFPVPLASYLIEASTINHEIVLDPFIGSGTTAIAAQRLGRHFIGIELNYRDIAISRIATAAAAIGVEFKGQKLDVKQLALDVFQRGA